LPAVLIYLCTYITLRHKVGVPQLPLPSGWPEWVNFGLMDDCFDCFFENYRRSPNVYATFYHWKSYGLILAKNDFGYILSDFTTNSSGPLYHLYFCSSKTHDFAKIAVNKCSSKTHGFAKIAVEATLRFFSIRDVIIKVTF
jgi:hypothetical protein